MTRSLERNTIVLAILLSTSLLSGCRFGNQVIQGVQPNPISLLANDTISGYYQSDVQDQLVCSNNSPSGGEVCRSIPATTVPTHSIPQIPFDVMTHVMGFVMTELPTQDSYSGSGYLVGLGSSSSSPPNFGVLVDSDNTFFNVARSAAAPAFFDSKCTVQWVLESRGRLNLASQTTQVGNYPIYGRVEAIFNVTQSFDGDCTASLQAMQSCYLSQANCGGANDSENTSRYKAVVAAFGDFIQAGTMSASDIPSVTKTAYYFAFQ